MNKKRLFKKTVGLLDIHYYIISRPVYVLRLVRYRNKLADYVMDKYNKLKKVIETNGWTEEFNEAVLTGEIDDIIKGEI